MIYGRDPPGGEQFPDKMLFFTVPGSRVRGVQTVKLYMLLTADKMCDLITFATAAQAGLCQISEP